jgi:hypothetical protein
MGVIRGVPTASSEPVEKSRHSSAKADCPLGLTLRRSTTIMDTMTYASVAALPWSVAQTNKHHIVSEAVFPSLNDLLFDFREKLNQRPSNSSS